MDYACEECGLRMVNGEGYSWETGETLEDKDGQMVKETIHFCSDECEDEYKRSKEAEQSGLVMEAVIATGRVDWQQLRMQKHTLIEVTSRMEKHPSPQDQEEAESLQGLLHFIDHIQDEAAMILGEGIVFCDYPGQEKVD